jgi:prepilin peptidase CpaA
MTLAAGLVFAASLLAAVSDVRTRRIPNALVIALFAGGLAANALLGWQAVAIDIAIVIAVLVAGSVAFSFRLIGGGDVKLLAAAAGTLGYPSAVTFILFTLLCGGVLAVAYSATRGRLGATIANVQSMALPLFAGARPARPQDSLAMPYALAIFAGAICTVIINGFVPHLRISL